MKKNKGFSLIELLIAVTLLSIIMIMVTQFMSTTSWAVTRTKKNQSIQTEAMEVGSQLTDTLMQATYIRVQAQNNVLYEIETNVSGSKKERNITSKNSVIGDLVVDDYPNYMNSSNRKVILDESTYALVTESGVRYPIAGDADYSYGQAVQSFRSLKDGKAVDEKPYYINPKYIYVQYKQKDAGAYYDAYAIFKFEGNAIYVNRGKMTDSGLDIGDGFKAARDSFGSSQPILTENVLDCYFSADTEANTLYIDMTFENPKFRGYSYNYVESIVLRNSNVLTVPPQQMYRWK